MKATLPTRALGSSGVEITKVGFGAWAIGGGGWSFGWGPQDDDSSIAAMRHALELGVNWIDTAAVYGLGHSEEVVGRLLQDFAKNPTDPLIFAWQCGLVWESLAIVWKRRAAICGRTLFALSARHRCAALASSA